MPSDDLCGIMPPIISIRIGGEEYCLTPLKVRDYLELERRLVAQRQDPLAAILPKLAELSDSAQRHLLGLAYEDLRRGNRLSVRELNEWLESAEGRVHQFWFSLRYRHPQISLDRAEELLETLLREQEERDPEESPLGKFARPPGPPSEPPGSVHPSNPFPGDAC